MYFVYWVFGLNLLLVLFRRDYTKFHHLQKERLCILSCTLNFFKRQSNGSKIGYISDKGKFFLFPEYSNKGLNENAII